MSSYLPDFNLSSVKNLNDALEKMANAKITPIAGGTDIMVLLDAGKLPKGDFLDIGKIHELKTIQESGEDIIFGALCTYTDIRESTYVRNFFPMMAEGARWSGAIAIQNRGTIGGNICNASPAGDTPPALLCYDAKIELTNIHGSRWVNYDEFHLGYKKTIKQPNELLTRIKIKKTNPNRIEEYKKVGTRLAQAISKICFSGLIELGPEKEIQKARLAWGAVGPYVLRSKETETILLGRKLSDNIIKDAVKQLDQEISPISDIRSNAEYRKKVCLNLLNHFLHQIKGH